MTIAEVTRAHHEDFNRALISNDLAKLSQVYANDYLLVRPDGTMFSKDQILADLKAQSMIFRSIESTNERIRVYGQVAVLTGDNEAVTLRDGNESKRRSRFVAIYVKQDERIELVHFQSNNLPGDAVG
jgi:ketosteroid isomerase-like protein